MKQIFVTLLLFVSVGLLALDRQLTLQVKRASDDLEEWLDEKDKGATDYSSTDLELGRELKDGRYAQLVGVRFSDVTLAQSTVIKSAYIEFELDSKSKTADPFIVHIRAEDADSTSTFNGLASEPYSVSSRPTLTDSIEWTIPEGQFNTVDMRYKTSDIGPLLQQLINRPHWKRGNAVTFFLKGVGTREVESYEGEPTAAAKLYISYVGDDTDADTPDGGESIEAVVESFNRRVQQSDYSIPSWTMYQRAVVSYRNAAVVSDTMGLHDAQLALVSKEMPYNVNMTINGSPDRQMGFAWYTNMGVAPGKVEIVAGKSSDFSSPLFTVEADTIQLPAVNYTVANNGLGVLANLPVTTKRSYSSHKALVTDLSPHTSYSYRVGKPGAWSEVGTFSTAPGRNNDFSFMYIADTQADKDAYFRVSAQVISAARDLIKQPVFCMVTGDLVETAGSNNSEWEWEQWFETNQSTWKNLPIAPICGNHDKSVNKNLTYHFNTQQVDFDQKMSTTPGSVYSFVCGDALFVACSTEDYKVPGYLDSLKNYIRREVAAHPTVRWKFAFYHKAVYTGSNSHQSDKDARIVREALVPVFDEAGIDIAFQGHDHIYEVIGATRNFSLVGNSYKQVVEVAGGIRENMTGKEGGVYNVQNGTLFFLNNSAGKKKYEPRNKEQMDAAFPATGITNYWGLFTGKFGQTGEPTFSEVKVTADTVYVKTYTVDDSAVAKEFDSFKVVKNPEIDTSLAGGVEPLRINLYPNPAKREIKVSGLLRVDSIELYNIHGELLLSNKAANELALNGLSDGVYLVKVRSGNTLFVDQVVVKN